ncbi:MAG: hypothetical protein RLZZ165_767 [Bacteroidota bacterium]|jgi:hypothetical protein
MKVFYFVSLVCNLILADSILKALSLSVQIYVWAFEPAGSLLSKLSFMCEVAFIINFMVIFFSCTPLAILVVKNHRYHGLLFLCLNVVAASLYFLYWYMSKNMDIEALYFETLYFLVSGILLSLVAHWSQMTLGKRLLPERYGGSAGGPAVRPATAPPTGEGSMEQSANHAGNHLI